MNNERRVPRECARVAREVLSGAANVPPKNTPARGEERIGEARETDVIVYASRERYERNSDTQKEQRALCVFMTPLPRPAPPPTSQPPSLQRQEHALNRTTFVSDAEVKQVNKRKGRGAF